MRKILRPAKRQLHPDGPELSDKPTFRGTRPYPTSIGREKMAHMSKLRPMPFEVLLLIFGFAVLVGCLRWYGDTRRQPPLSRRAKWLTFGVVLTLFLFLVALNAVANYRFGFPQF
jgi:hypothetical protein